MDNQVPTIQLRDIFVSRLMSTMGSQAVNFI